MNQFKSSPQNLSGNGKGVSLFRHIWSHHRYRGSMESVLCPLLLAKNALTQHKQLYMLEAGVLVVISIKPAQPKLWGENRTPIEVAQCKSLKPKQASPSITEVIRRNQTQTNAWGIKVWKNTKQRTAIIWTKVQWSGRVWSNINYSPKKHSFRIPRPQSAQSKDQHETGRVACHETVIRKR